MNLTHLPLEILLIVIEHIDNKADYCNLRISCKDMYHIMNNITQYYLSGAIKKSFSYYNHFLTGVYREFYRYGCEKIYMQFSNGKINGTVEVYNVDYKKIYDVGFKDNKKVTDETICYENGIVAQITPYSTMGIHGKQRLYYSDSELKVELNYKNNILDGSCNYYYNNGVTKYILSFKNGALNGACIGFYRNGHMKFLLNYYNGLLNYGCRYYFANGYISCKYWFINGVMKGPQMQYHENGKLKMIFKVVNGKLNGKMKTWYANGEPNVSCEFKDNKLIDKAIMYRDGYKHIFNLNSDYLFGSFCGLFSMYNKKGMIYTAEIEHNELHGILKDYGDNLVDNEEYILDTSNEFKIFQGNKLINIEKNYLNIYQSYNNIKAISYKIDNKSYFKII